MQKNNAAFLSFLEANQGIVFKVAHTYSSNPEDKKDLVQEIILQLWYSFKKYDPNLKASTWVFRIALNVAIAYARKDKNRKRILGSRTPDFVEYKAESDGLAERKERENWLYGIISKLNPIERAIMVLYLEENSYEEIAEILGFTKTKVATRINRIKQKLKEQYVNTL